MDAAVTVRVFWPPSGRQPAPALLWMHGGGMVVGIVAMEDAFCRRVSQDLDVVVASVEYRFAPEHPYPTPLDDCAAALRWLANRPEVEASRIAVGGQSAGGGLAAALALRARDEGEITPVVHLLTYPMLDDRTTSRTDIDRRRLRLWDQSSNTFAWHAYLGGDPNDVPPLAAPARVDDLTGVAPAWIGVGTLDLFHDEDVTYARRLQDAGVSCHLEVVAGAYHGFDLAEPWTNVVRAFRASQLAALDHALNGRSSGRAASSATPSPSG